MLLTLFLMKICLTMSASSIVEVMIIGYHDCSKFWDIVVGKDYIVVPLKQEKLEQSFCYSSYDKSNWWSSSQEDLMVCLMFLHQGWLIACHGNGWRHSSLDLQEHLEILWTLLFWGYKELPRSLILVLLTTLRTINTSLLRNSKKTISQSIIRCNKWRR